jgi:hypothetical protein
MHPSLAGLEKGPPLTGVQVTGHIHERRQTAVHNPISMKRIFSQNPSYKVAPGRWLAGFLAATALAQSPLPSPLVASPNLFLEIL